MVFMGINGGPSRCYHFWMDFQECMHENFEKPTTCQALVEDYLECLHHRKYYEKQLAIAAEKKKQEEAAKAEPKHH